MKINRHKARLFGIKTGDSQSIYNELAPLVYASRAGKVEGLIVLYWMRGDRHAKWAMAGFASRQRSASHLALATLLSHLVDLEKGEPVES